MSHIYNREEKRTDEFQYEISGGGRFLIEDKGFICLTFENKKLVKCSLPFQPPFSRNQMRILYDVEEEIRRIEKDFENEEIVKRQHSHLLNTVSEKFEGETRYDTALRYIEEAEGYHHNEPEEKMKEDASSKDDS